MCFLHLFDNLLSYDVSSVSSLCSFVIVARSKLRPEYFPNDQTNRKDTRKTLVVKRDEIAQCDHKRF